MKLYRKIRSWRIKLLYNKEEREIIAIALMSQKDSYIQTLNLLHKKSIRTQDEYITNRIKMHDYISGEFYNIVYQNINK